MVDYTTAPKSTGEKLTAAEWTAASVALSELVAGLDEADTAIGAQGATIAANSASIASQGTTIAANSASITALQTGKQPKFMTGTSTTAQATVARTVTLDSPWASATPAVGDIFVITHTNGINANAPTLAINGGTAYPIRGVDGGVNNYVTYVEPGAAHIYRFDGTYFRLMTPGLYLSESATTQISDPTSSSLNIPSPRRLALLRSPTPIGDVITTPAGFTTIPRTIMRASSLVSSSGAFRLSHFRCPLAGNRSNVTVLVSVAPSGGSPTLIRLGVWRVETNGDYTPLATTANDVTLFNVFGPVTKALSGAVNFVAGQEYALGFLIVQAAGTLPGVYSSTSPDAAEGSLPPRIVGAIFSQTDLPTGTIAAATPTTSGTGVVYARFS